MFVQTIRSLLLLQIVLLVAPLNMQVVNGARKRLMAIRIGFFICMIGVIFSDVGLLPEVFGVMLTLLNYLLVETGYLPTRQFFARWKYVLHVSMAVFAASFVWRFVMGSEGFAMHSGSRLVLHHEGDKARCDDYGRKSFMVDVDRKVREVCDFIYGVGSYKNACIVKKEDDSAYIFFMSLQGGTNCVVNVMKKDGKVVVTADYENLKGTDTRRFNR